MYTRYFGYLKIGKLFHSRGMIMEGASKHSNGCISIDTRPICYISRIDTINNPIFRTSSDKHSYPCRTYSKSSVTQQGNHDQSVQDLKSLYFSYLTSSFDKISGKIEELIDDEIIIDVRDPDPSVLEIETVEGVFVLSRQRANEELWLSSPISGPWHYKMEVSNTNSREMQLSWVCTREGEKPFWERFTEEISSLIGKEVDFGNVSQI